MSDREGFKELPFIEDDDEAITYIVQEMAEKVERPKGEASTV